MKQTVRIMTLILCVILIAAAIGCGAGRQADARPSVVVTIFPQYDFIRAIAGDRVQLTMLVKPGSEVHGYDPTFSEVSEILNADLFVYVGGESDRWVEDVISKTDKSVRTLKLMDMVDALDEETIEGMQTEEEETQADEHVWTSPKNAIRIVNGLTDALCGLLPEEADAMRKNADAYVSELTERKAHDRRICGTLSVPVFLRRIWLDLLCRAARMLQQ